MPKKTKEPEERYQLTPFGLFGQILGDDARRFMDELELFMRRRNDRTGKVTALLIEDGELAFVDVEKQEEPA